MPRRRPPTPGASEEDIMKNTNLLALLAVIGTSTTALVFAGCSSSSSNETAGDASTNDVTTTGDDGGADSSSPGNDSSSPGNDGSSAEASSEAGPNFPAPPALGTLIDRMGRPAVNTALNSTFYLAATTDGGTVNCLAPGLCPAKDTYNQDGTPSDWGTNWAKPFFLNLAIFDSLDGVCGNQAGWNATIGGTLYPQYSALAGVLAEDALWVNTGSTTCNVYLGVELNTLGITNTDCGGRTLTENTIDVTYNLAAGTETIGDAGAPVLPITGPATNGITAPSNAPSTTFPYFATPH
jgi:hypothetical protein